MRITTVFSQRRPFTTVVSARGARVNVTPGTALVAVTQVTTGLTGKSGTGSAQISADADNQLVEGSDQRLFVPPAQATADPLAYYILASN